MYIVLDFEDFLMDLDHLHVEVPVVLGKVKNVLRRGLKTHAKAIEEQAKNIKEDASVTMNRINRRDKIITKTVNKYKDLLKRLNRQEEHIVSKYKASISVQLKGVNSEIDSIMKSKTVKASLSKIALTKREISNNIIGLQKELNSLFIISDCVLYDNILLSHTYGANQEMLKKLLDGMDDGY